MFELTFDIGEQPTRAEAEEVRTKPPVTEFLLHEDEPVEGLLRRTDTAGGLESHFVTGARSEVANHARHHQTHGQRGVTGFLAGAGFDKIGTGHHGHLTGPSDVRERSELAHAENGLQVGFAAGVAECTHFVVQRLPVSREHVRARDHDIDFGGASRHRRMDFSESLSEW